MKIGSFKRFERQKEMPKTQKPSDCTYFRIVLESFYHMLWITLELALKELAFNGEIQW